MSDFRQCSNRLQVDLISLLVNVLYELDANNDKILPNLAFGKFSAARQLIINGGAIRPERPLVCQNQITMQQ